MFDLSRFPVNLNGVTLDGFSTEADAFMLEAPDPLGTLTKGTGGKSVFVVSNSEKATLTLKLLQHGESNKMLNDLLNQQRNDPQNFSPISVYAKDIINGDEIRLNGGYFETRPTIARGSEHNVMEWQIVFAKSDINLTGGK